MSNVIHANFRKPSVDSITIQATSEVLYRDEQVILVRTRLAVNGDLSTTHFLAHREGERVEVIPVNA